MKEMTSEVRGTIKIMLRALIQYGDMSDFLVKNEGGLIKFVSLSHGAMSAGEDLSEMLEDYGLAREDGLSFYLTDAGLALMNED